MGRFPPTDFIEVRLVRAITKLSLLRYGYELKHLLAFLMGNRATAAFNTF